LYHYASEKPPSPAFLHIEVADLVG
jgi:hypothetical protein